jgi:hypothetical protein
MAIGIGRRELVAGFGVTAVIWPLATRAQQPALPVIGFLGAASAEVYAPRLVASFRLSPAALRIKVIRRGTH